MATKKRIPFTLEGIRRFTSLNDAIKYYGEKESGSRLRRSVSSLYVQAWEFNVGRVSLNLSSFIKDYRLNVDLLNEYLGRLKKFSNDDQRWSIIKKAEQQVEVWYGRAK